jgi:hypothetical protein
LTSTRFADGALFHAVCCIVLCVCESLCVLVVFVRLCMCLSR